MAYDEGYAQIYRDTLSDVHGLTEKRMFGGLCFLLNGNMLGGVDQDGGMWRVGPDNYEAALQIDGAAELSFTGRPMKGLIEVAADSLEDTAAMKQWKQMALDFVGGLPGK